MDNAIAPATLAEDISPVAAAPKATPMAKP